MNGSIVPSLLVMALANACGNSDSATAAGNTGGASVTSHSGGSSGIGTESSVLTGGNSAANTTSGGTTTSNGGSSSGGNYAQQSSQLPIGGGASNGGTNAGAGGAPSGGASSTAAVGGATSVALGGASAAGGTTTTGGAVSTSGTMPIGGSHTSGGATSATTTGSSHGDAGPTAVVNMTLRLGATADDSTEVDLTLPDGAASIPAADITLTWCGRLGGGTTLDASALRFDQATLVCPVNATADCSYAANYVLTPSVSASAPGMNGCYDFDLNAPARSLWPKGLIKLVYRVDPQSEGAILNRQFEEIWSVLVEGDIVGHCTIPPLPSVTPVCG